MSQRVGKPAARRRPGRPRGPSQAAQLRRRLIDEASQLYAAGGYNRLSFATVAARTGLTKATVFHYFPNKDALLRAVFEAFGERLEQADNWFAPPAASHSDRLERLVAALVTFYAHDPLNARILCHGLLEFEHLAPWITPGAHELAPFDRFVSRFIAFIAAGADAGEFYPDRPMATILAIGGIILFELMLPDQGRSYRRRANGEVSRAERTAEITALINRTVVRPQVRLERRRTVRDKKQPF